MDEINKLFEYVKEGSFKLNNTILIIDECHNLVSPNGTYYKLLKDYLVKNKMKCVVHASYTINLSKQWDEYSAHIHQFINEIEKYTELKNYYINFFEQKGIKVITWF